MKKAVFAGLTLALLAFPAFGDAFINRQKSFTGVPGKWPWQLNIDGSWTNRQPAAGDVIFAQGAAGTVNVDIYCIPL